MMKNNKKSQSSKYKQRVGSILYSELAPLSSDVTRSKFQRDRENITDQNLLMEHTPKYNQSS